MQSLRVLRMPSAKLGYTTATTNRGTSKLERTHSTDLSPLSQLYALKELDLSQNEISGKLSYLSSCVELRTLRLSNNPALMGELDALESLTALEILELEKTQVQSSIEPLGRMLYLTVINLRGVSERNFFGSIVSLSKLSKLRNLLIGTRCFEFDSSSEKFELSIKQVARRLKEKRAHKEKGPAAFDTHFLQVELQQLHEWQATLRNAAVARPTTALQATTDLNFH